jgi:hypothetical protein
VELVLIAIVVAVVVVAVVAAGRRSAARSASELADAKAHARQLIERLGGQVYHLSGTNSAAQQALADASERLNAAGSQIATAETPAQARLAGQTAAEGLYYIRAAREAMGIDPGPPVPELGGQRAAGAVGEEREVDFEGRRIAASPRPSDRTPNYYPGGMVAGRPVPAGWYSEPWWRPALVAGAWGMGSALLFSALFTGMPGVGYVEAGADDSSGAEDTDQGDGWGDAEAGGDYGGGDYGGGDYGGGDYGAGGDFGGGDFGGGDFGGGF